ncbi:hypothetical protein H0E87_017142 [Populus deltoides]|uniref:D-isomer specific 2-hydroxyacid dehydrogenase catalytic domain-containing protein n=1 Tax=Populus deltoides TaxID=3696 RepID=A0A8T2XZ24_POPDE|nr:hypothetical protein H0E87_017142 [Populus deltoides]
MAVGYNNVDVSAANKYGFVVGNSPGVLTETTAELAASLSLAAARRIVEADQFMREGLYDGWLPLLETQKAGDVPVQFIMPTNERCRNPYGEFLKANGEQPVTGKGAASMDEVLRKAEVVGYLCYKSSPNIGQNHLPLDQQRKACNNEEGRNLK